MTQVVIIGAGGHGREVAEILGHQALAGADVHAVGFIDENQSLHGQMVAGLPVLGDWSWFDEVERVAVAVICAVGLPQVSRRLIQRAKARGLSFVNAISPLAHVSPTAKLGWGIVVFPQVIVSTGVCLGSYCILNVGVTVSHDTQVGKYSNINPGVHLAGDTSIGEGCYVGMGTNVIQRRSIGSWTVIGAGAAVVHDIPANVTAVGVPARVIKTQKEGWHER
jgi:sugar O-acyltransferase (sialic acid O-acetyltransferase NeuD family)